MKFDIVVAHYKENIDWIRGLNHPSIRRVFVYTKGPVVSDLNDERVFHSYLPNVGRESHTYLWHCVHNFKDIAEGRMSDFTFFVQGAPHSMDAKTIIAWIDEAERYSLDFTLNYRISSPYDFLASGRVKFWAGPTHAAEFGVKEWCDAYVNPAVDFKKMPIFWNACFGVSSECVADSGRERLATIQQKELSTLNPECGHYCERLWYHIFRMERRGKRDLPPGFWHFLGGSDGKKHYGVMKLKEDGNIGFYDNFNERHWSKGESSILLKSGDGKVTSELKRVSDDEYSGEFIGPQKSLHKITRRNPSEE